MKKTKGTNHFELYCDEYEGKIKRERERRERARNKNKRRDDFMTDWERSDG